MDFFITHFKGICIGLMFVCLLLLVFVASSEKEEEVGVGVEVLAVRDDTLVATVRVDMADEGDYQPLVVMNEAPMGVGIPIGKILGYESDVIKRTPFDPPIEPGYPAMGLLPSNDYSFVRVDVNGHLLCSKVDRSVWKLTPVDKKVEETTGLNDSLIIRNDAPMPEPSMESMP